MANPWQDDAAVITTTTPTIEGRPVREYLGVVTGEVIVGANLFRDLFANIRDIVGGGRQVTNASCARHAKRRSRNWSANAASAGAMRWLALHSIMR